MVERTKSSSGPIDAEDVLEVFERRLYDAADLGAKDEREAIVAWLRRLGGPELVAIDRGAAILCGAAERIEAGEHRKKRA